MRRRELLVPLLDAYIRDDAAEAVRRLESAPAAEAVMLLAQLPTKTSQTLFSQLREEPLASMIPEISSTRLPDLVQALTSSQAATVILRLTAEHRERLVEALSPQMKLEVQEWLRFPEGSAGRMMHRDFLAFPCHITAKEAIQRLRQSVRKNASPSYLYVVDQEAKLVGVINMRDLMLAGPDTTLDTFMRREVFSVHAFTDREPLAEELSKRRYFAVPVVDSDQRLLGVVKAEELLKGAQEEATEDLQRMFGAGADERAFSPIEFSLRKRVPWLVVNLGTAFLAGSVIALFEDTIAQISVLAVFLPIVAGQGGNAGTQSLAVVMRGLVMHEIPPQKAKNLVLKETAIGVMNGLLFGAITGLASWAWKSNPYLGLVVALGMLVNLTAAGLSGAVIPLFMKRLGFDPAQSSGIVLTTVTDVIGFFAFLSFAVLFRNLLI